MSEKHVKEQKHAAFNTALANDAIATLLNLLISLHNFYGQVTSLRSRRTSVINTTTLWCMWISPEVLQQFKLRWDDMVKEASRVGIDGDLYKVGFIISPSLW